LALSTNDKNQPYSCETNSLCLAYLSSFLTAEGLFDRFHPLRWMWSLLESGDALVSLRWLFHDLGFQVLLAATEDLLISKSDFKKSYFCIFSLVLMLLFSALLICILIKSIPA